MRSCHQLPAASQVSRSLRSHSACMNSRPVDGSARVQQFVQRRARSRSGATTAVGSTRVQPSPSSHTSAQAWASDCRTT